MEYCQIGYVREIMQLWMIQKILVDNKNIDTERTFACAANV